MKKIVIILGFLSAILAVILSTTPLSKLAFIPCVLAFAFGLSGYMISKDKREIKKSVQLIFLMTIVALVLTTYKTLFTKVEVGNTEQLEHKEDQLEEESLEELENLEIDEIDIQ